MQASSLRELGAVSAQLLLAPHRERRHAWFWLLTLLAAAVEHGRWSATLRISVALSTLVVVAGSRFLWQGFFVYVWTFVSSIIIIFVE